MLFLQTGIKQGQVVHVSLVFSHPGVTIDWDIDSGVLGLDWAYLEVNHWLLRVLLILVLIMVILVVVNRVHLQDTVYVRRTLGQ